MSANHYALRHIRDEFLAAKEKYGPFFHAILKMPPAPRRGATITQAEGVLRALAMSSLAHSGISTNLLRLMIAAASNGETEWAYPSIALKSWSKLAELTTRAYHCLPSECRLQEPIHQFVEKPFFSADYGCRWMLFVYRRLANVGSLVVRRRFTELEFNRYRPPFPLEAFDSNVIVTYLSVDAFLASANAIDVELNTVPSSSIASEPPATPKKKVVRDQKAEARDKWIYKQCCNRVPYDKIKIELKKIACQRGWKIVSSKQRIHQIGNEYADRRGLERPPPRQNL